jgi:signal transduction histidine kinase
VRLPLPGPHAGFLEIERRGRPPLIGWQVVLVVLVVVGVSSWLLARSLTRPLRRLSDTARALGGGDLAARTGLQRADELGEVAHAFDEMADRVAALLRAEKELLASISHELRTPLARIRVALDLAAEGDAEVARESLAEIAGDLDELERLIHDVLTAARLDLGSGGVPPLRRERLAPEALLEQAAARFRSAHPGRPLACEIEGGLAEIDGDPVLLRRVIDNLLENAHKYTEQPQAPITLRARKTPGGGVEIEVIDQGIGISEEDLSRVFRPFFRADRSRTRATGGLGLGLALSRRIVEAHGGAIALKSELDRGTRALVLLPAPSASTSTQPAG